MSKSTDKYYLSIHHRSISININPDDGFIMERKNLRS